MISFEFSASKLSPYVLRPPMIRAIDWVEVAWPQDLRQKKLYPTVEKAWVCLTTVMWVRVRVRVRVRMMIRKRVRVEGKENGKKVSSES